MTAQIIPFRIERQTDGEMRVSETELAQRLGYSRERDFRRIVNAHRARLDRMGSALLLRETSGEQGGRPKSVEWFTEHQALFLISRSDTTAADDIMEAISIAFVEMRRQTQRSLPIREWFQLNIISEQVSIWEREFSAGFFNHLHRMLGVTKPGRNNHSNCAHFINRYVYTFLFSNLGLEVIREANPAGDEYRRAVRHHQVLKERHKPALRQHIDRIGIMLSNAISLQHFDDMFNRSFPMPDTQIGFIFQEPLLPAVQAAP